MTTPQSPQTSTAVEALLDELINQVEWSVKVPGAVAIDRDKQHAAKAKAKAQIAALIRDAKIEELEDLDLVIHQAVSGPAAHNVIAKRIDRIKALTEEVTDHE